MFIFCLYMTCLVQAQYHPSFPLKLLVTTVTEEIIIIVATVIIIVTGSVGEFPTSRCSFLPLPLLMSLSTLSEIHIWSKTKVQGTGKHLEIVSLRQTPKLRISMRIVPAVGQDVTLSVYLAIYKACYNAVMPTSNSTSTIWPCISKHRDLWSHVLRVRGRAELIPTNRFTDFSSPLCTNASWRWRLYRGRDVLIPRRCGEMFPEAQLSSPSSSWAAKMQVGEMKPHYS